MQIRLVFTKSFIEFQNCINVETLVEIRDTQNPVSQYYVKFIQK